MRLLNKSILIGLITLVSVSAMAQNTEKEIKAMLQTRDKEIKEVLGPEGAEYTEAQKETLKTMINDIIDFKAMSQTALDETYNEISEEQRAEFVDLFSSLIKENSLVKLEIYRAQVSYDEVTIEDDKALVKTMAELDNVRTPVYYKMELEDGEWVIVDMSIDDVYTAESYHRQFSRIIRKKGFDGLMDTLRKRMAR